MSRPNDTIVPSELTASDALREIIAVLKEHFPLETPGRKWADEDIYRVLIQASVMGCPSHAKKVAPFYMKWKRGTPFVWPPTGPLPALPG